MACGGAPSCLSEENDRIEFRHHGLLPGKGVQHTLPKRKGEVTLLKWAGPIDGKNKILIAQGYAVQCQWEKDNLSKEIT
jgi:hypothetical protein